MPPCGLHVPGVLLSRGPGNTVPEPQKYKGIHLTRWQEPLPTRQPDHRYNRILHNQRESKQERTLNHKPEFPQTRSTTGGISRNAIQDNPETEPVASQINWKPSQLYDS